jgi:hypothetical protein
MLMQAADAYFFTVVWFAAKIYSDVRKPTWKNGLQY